MMRNESLPNVPALISGFSLEPEPGLRALMVRAASRFDPKGGRALLEKALGDSAPMVRSAAASALSREGDVAAARLLAAALSSEPDPGARLTMAFLLGFSGLPRGGGAVSALSQVLSSDKDPNVRLQAAQSLARIGGFSARSALRGARNDPDPRVRRAAGGR